MTAPRRPLWQHVPARDLVPGDAVFDLSADFAYAHVLDVATSGDEVAVTVRAYSNDGGHAAGQHSLLLDADRMCEVARRRQPEL
ncbi:MAG: hypothetical protein QM655_14195 [Nocardioidaceae bacterium]